MLQSWTDFCNAVTCETVYQILEAPLWYNRNLHNGENLCIQNWFKKGIRSLIDIIDARGNIYQFNELKAAYNIRGTFLDYQFLLRKITDPWKKCT